MDQFFFYTSYFGHQTSLPFPIFAAMIAYLEGNFVFKSPAVVHIDVNGVGYEVQISLHTYSKIQHLEKGILHTCLLIREDAHLLYGFYDKAEKEMFLHLISVSGIGASTARVMLSYMRPEEISKYIILGDTKTLEGVKGIGKKTADRIVLELRDKLTKLPVDVNISPMRDNSLRQDALIALTALGINRQAADQAVSKVLQSNPSLNKIEDVIKLSLKSL